MTTHTRRSVRKLLPKMFPDHKGGPARRRIVGPVTPSGDATLFIVRSRTPIGGQMHTLMSLSVKDGIAKASEVLTCIEQSTAERMAAAMATN